jgi:hypothetical protein
VWRKNARVISPRGDGSRERKNFVKNSNKFEHLKCNNNNYPRLHVCVGGFMRSHMCRSAPFVSGLA